MSTWYPAEYITQPFYPRVFKIRDLSPTHLVGDRLAYWTKCRDAALDMWKVGMSVRVAQPTAGYKPGFITLDVTQTQDGTAGQAWFGALPPDAVLPAPGVAWAHIDTETFEQQYLSGYSAPMRRIIAHEIGHTLGFGHGGTGVMAASHQGGVNDEEISALRAYWKT